MIWQKLFEDIYTYLYLLQILKESYSYINSNLIPLDLNKLLYLILYWYKVQTYHISNKEFQILMDKWLRLIVIVLSHYCLSTKLSLEGSTKVQNIDK